MKIFNFLAIIFLILNLCSCEIPENNFIGFKKSENEISKIESARVDYLIFDVENHTYIFFRVSNCMHKNTIIHSPDCKCKKNEN